MDDLRLVRRGDREGLAQVYLSAYPPEVGAADADEALAEIDETFSGGYGVLRADASLVAVVDGRPVGAVLVTERSIWDPDLDGPFVIDLFVEAGHRGAGLGRALMVGAMRACAAAEDSSLSLRVGNGTSAAAHHLYRVLGFRPPSAAASA